MKIELECTDEVVDEMVVQALISALECVKMDKERLRDKPYLTKAEKKDLKYDKKIAKALRWVIAHFSIPE